MRCRPTRPFAPLLALIALLGTVTLTTGCAKTAPPEAVSTTQKALKAQTAGLTAPQPASVDAADPVVGTVDETPIHLSWVRARLAQAESNLGDAEATAAALLAAAADVSCLREFAVLDLKPNPGEQPHAAVDRLLAGTWPSTPACRVDPADLKLAYLGQPSRWRHPTALTLWEAQITCCTGCSNVELDQCQTRTAAAAVTLHAALTKAIPPPLAATRTTLAASPARARHVPAFERALADSRVSPTPTLLRYTAFAREAAFQKMAFRRTDPSLERAARPLPIGALTPPVRTAAGWSVAMVVGHEGPLAGGLRSPETLRGLRAEVCKTQAASQRRGYRDRMLGKAVLRWHRGLIRAHLGAAVDAALPEPPRRERPTLPID